MNLSADTLAVLARLRPPFARSALVLFPYTREGSVNSGITVETVAGEPAIAAGTGAVQEIYTEMPQWQTTDETMPKVPVYHILLNHQGHVTTLIGGLTTVNVIKGQTVYRGDVLGTLYTNQLFFSCAVANKTINPLAINPRWNPQNGDVVLGQGGKIRFAPDRIARDLSNGLAAAFNNGWRYFYGLMHPKPLLVNIDFNGSGLKTGLAATGFHSTDYWNVYVPEDFFSTISNACYYYYPTSYGFISHFRFFGAAAAIYLRTYDNLLSPVFLERIAPQFSAAATGLSWDEMLKTWVGGYLGPVPYENTFRLRNMPAGTYNLYLYSNQNGSTFYASVGTGLPTSQANNPTLTPAFIQGRNYVLFTLVVPVKSYITFKAVGFLSGLQLLRV